MARPFTITVLLCALVFGATAGRADAWSVHSRVWLKPQITYDARGGKAWQAANYAAWVWRRAGVRFVPVRRDADVSVRIAGRCGGEATVGYRRPSFVRLGRCRLASRALLAVHEFGHVLGLAHENRYCSRMNSFVHRDGTPALCSRAPAAYWLRHPLTRDDVAGAHWIEGQAEKFRQQASRRSDSNR